MATKIILKSYLKELKEKNSERNVEENYFSLKTKIQKLEYLLKETEKSCHPKCDKEQMLKFAQRAKIIKTSTNLILSEIIFLNKRKKELRTEVNSLHETVPANCKILKLVTNEINNHILKNKAQSRENETLAPTVETFDATMTKREENDTHRDTKKRLSSDLNDSTLNGLF